MATSNEQLLAAIVRHQVDVLRFAKGEARAVAKMLKAAEDDLVARIAARTERGLSQFGTDRLEALLVSVREAREKALKAVGGRIKDGLSGLAEAEAEFEIDVIRASLPFHLELATVPAPKLRALANSPIRGVPVDGWIDSIAKADVGRLESALRLAVVEGWTPQDLTRRIRADLGVTAANAEALGRTAVNHVSNRARQEVWEANSDIVTALRWTSTLDGRTSAVCRSRDGALVPVGDSKLPAGARLLDPANARPPAHFNCRSVMVPVIDGVAAVGERPFVRDARRPQQRLKDFRADARAKVGDAAWKAMTPAQRNAAIAAERRAWAEANVGRVPAKMTYEEWLRKQPEAFQDEVLGAGKARLFRQGMTLDKFVDASGKELTLAQLRAEGKGQTLHLEQPGIGLKAKAYLQQGLDADAVLQRILAEFPDAKTTPASIASYKSELKKAGLLNTLPPVASKTAPVGTAVAAAADHFEAGLPLGVRKAVGGAWYQVVDDLSGPTYAHYKAGLGVQLSAKKLAALPAAQAQQVMAHELAHMLHKQHGLPGVKQLDEPQLLSAAKASLSPTAKKNYAYYLASDDELTAEVYAQALRPSPITSQGLDATEFNKVFGGYIEAAKSQLAAKFPNLPEAQQYGGGFPVKGTGLVGGKPSGVTEYIKALAQQGMGNDDILAAVKAQFPNAKTTKASISSIKSVMKKNGELGQSSPGVVIHATNATPKPPPSIVNQAPGPSTVTAADLIVKFGYGDSSGALLPKYQGVTIQKSIYKKLALELVKAGYGNKEIAEELSSLLTKAKYGPKNVASWKAQWKKEGKLAAAQAAAGAGDAGMAPPKLKVEQLGPHSKKGLIEAEKMFATGATHQQVEAFLAKHFGSWDPMKGADLIYLAEYNAKTKKFTSSASPAPKAVYTAPKADPVAGVDMTPTRPATSPADSWPPPPRFSEEQRAAGIMKILGEPLDTGAKFEQLNATLRREGLAELTPAEYTAVRLYTGAGYSKLNSMLRSARFADDLYLQAYVDAAQAGIRKMAMSPTYRHRGVANRGTTLSSVEWEKFKKVYVKGAIIEEHAFLSTSTASGFGGRIRFRVHSKTGVKVETISYHPNEKEVLFLPGARFRVDNVVIGPDSTFVEMTEISDF